MAGRKVKSTGPVDRQGGIAKAKEAARRGASERAAEARGEGEAFRRDGAERSESRPSSGEAGRGGRSGPQD